MRKLDEGALLCDFAETYGIYDLDSLPRRTIATLAAGLGDDSRIRRKAAGTRVRSDTYLLAAIFDRLGSIMYMLSNGDTERPASILSILSGKDADTGASQCRGFESGEAFDKAWKMAVRNAGG